MRFRLAVLQTAPVALGIVSCSCRGPAGDPSTLSAQSPTTIVPASSASALSTAVDEPLSLDALFASEPWAHLRSVWQQVERPVDGGTPALDASQRQQLRQQLQGAANNVEPGAANLHAMNLLTRVMLTYFDDQSRPPRFRRDEDRLRVMMSHVGPQFDHPPRYDPANQLNSRLYALVSLYHQGQIGSETWQAALDSLEDDIKFAAVFEAAGLGTPRGAQADSSIAKFRTLIQQRYQSAEAVDAGTEALAVIRKRVDDCDAQVARLIPIIRTMMSDLRR